MKIKNALISAFSFMALVCLFTVCINAEEAASKEFKYRVLNDGTVEIIEYIGSSESVEIPKKLDGKMVTVIGYNAFCNNEKLKSVKIPDGVTIIKDGYEAQDMKPCGAFSGCASLISVHISGTVTNIGSYAFMNCSSLAEIQLPDSVNVIGKSAFDGSRLLKKINIPESVTRIEENAFENTALLTAQNDGINYIDNWLINCGKDVDQLEIKNGTKGIAGYAFKNCVLLKNISIPKSVQYIGEGAFYGCKSLEKIAVPSGVETIERVTFIDCISLENVIIPDSVRKIDISVFTHCSSLTHVDIPEGVKEIYDNVFYGCTALKSVFIPQSVEMIVFDAFKGCPSLTAVYCEQKEENFNYSTNVFLTTSGSRTKIYYGCKFITTDKLKGIESDDEVTVTFYTDEAATAVIPEQIGGNPVTRVEGTAFVDGRKIETLYIPKSVREICSSALGGCNNLKKIYYAGTEAEWEALSKDNDQDFLASVDIVCNCAYRCDGGNTPIIISMIVVSLVVACGFVLLAYCIRKRER